MGHATNRPHGTAVIDRAEGVTSQHRSPYPYPVTRTIRKVLPVQVSPEPTPNPNAIKFTLDRPSTDGGAETFKEGADPAASPLGAGIFALGDVTNVFATANFVSVTKTDTADWNDLGPKVVQTIEAHFGEAAS